MATTASQHAFLHSSSPRLSIFPLSTALSPSHSPVWSLSGTPTPYANAPTALQQPTSTREEKEQRNATATPATIPPAATTTATPPTTPTSPSSRPPNASVRQRSRSQVCCCILIITFISIFPHLLHVLYISFASLAYT